MKILTAAILIMSLLTFQFSELLVYLSFKLNQEYIAQNLCVEKDVDGSTCKGCCQLKKRMDEQKNSKNALPPVHNEKQSIDFWIEDENCRLTFTPETDGFISTIKFDYIFTFLVRIFRPPQ